MEQSIELSIGHTAVLGSLAVLLAHKVLKGKAVLLHYSAVGNGYAGILVELAEELDHVGALVDILRERKISHKDLLSFHVVVHILQITEQEIVCGEPLRPCTELIYLLELVYNAEILFLRHGLLDILGKCRHIADIVFKDVSRCGLFPPYAEKANIPFTVYQLKLILVYPVLLFQPCLHKGIAVLIKKLGSDAACHKFTP